MLESNGTIFAFGDAAHHGNAAPAIFSMAVDIEPTR